jgi:hypothetical protein
VGSVEAAGAVAVLVEVVEDSADLAAAQPAEVAPVGHGEEKPWTKKSRRNL